MKDPDLPVRVDLVSITGGTAKTVMLGQSVRSGQAVDLLHGNAATIYSQEQLRAAVAAAKGEDSGVEAVVKLESLEDRRGGGKRKSYSGRADKAEAKKRAASSPVASVGLLDMRPPSLVPPAVSSSSAGTTWSADIRI